MGELVQDLRFALRGLRRSPGFTAVAVLTLALGIGATSAIFSVVDSVLLRPLPYRDPGRIVTVLHGGNFPVAPANYLDWRAQSRSFARSAAAQAWGATLTGRGRAELMAPALQVTADLFAVLGVGPALGRSFRPGDDQPGAPATVVLGHRLWQRRFGADAAVVGQSVTLDGRAYTVIGVMPPGFEFAPFWVRNAELWTPLDLANRRDDRKGESLRVFARLAPGITPAQAQAETDAIWRRLERDHPGTTKADVVVGSLHEKVVGKVRRPLLILLAGVGFVLLIACANVANLLLARSAGRRKELAIRASLGAGRVRLLRQLLTESFALAALGGTLGVLLARWGVEALVALGPRDLPRFEAIAVDGRVLLCSLLLTVVTALAFGLVPALQLSSVNVQGALQAGTKGASEGGGGNRIRGVLVVTQTALATVLLIGAGLMIRSFHNLRGIDPGFEPRGVLSVDVPMPDARARLVEASPEEVRQQGARRRALAEQAVARVRALPGVASVSGINHLPIGGDIWTLEFALDDGDPPPPPGQEPRAVYRVIAPHYARTMGLALRRGRDFDERDALGAPGVAIVNESFARAYWPGQDAIGKHIRVEDHGPNPRIIVGVVEDARQRDWARPPGPEMYLAYLQNPSSSLTLVVRTAALPMSLAPAVEQAIAGIDANLPVPRVRPMQAVVADALGQPRFNLLLLNLFAALALVLAAVGIYGIVAHSVSRRTREIGIRLALGAPAARVLGMVVSRGLALTALGVAIGLAGALLTTRLMAALLFEVSATDPLTFLTLALLLLAVAALASYLPARRATRIHPTMALREE
jgi:predicted permease